MAEKAAYQRQVLVEQQSGADEQTARQRHLEGSSQYHAMRGDNQNESLLNPNPNLDISFFFNSYLFTHHQPTYPPPFFFLFFYPLQTPLTGLAKETETWRDRAGQMEKDKDALRATLTDLQQQLTQVQAGTPIVKKTNTPQIYYPSQLREPSFLLVPTRSLVQVTTDKATSYHTLMCPCHDLLSTYSIYSYPPSTLNVQVTADKATSNHTLMLSACHDLLSTYSIYSYPPSTLNVQVAADKATSEARCQQQLALQIVDRDGLEARLTHQLALVRSEKDQLEATSQQQVATLSAEKTALEARLKALEEGYLMVRQQAQSRAQTEATAQEQVTTLLAEKTALEMRLRSLEEGYLQARAREEQRSQVASPSQPAVITPVMMAEGEFLRHVTARVQVGDPLKNLNVILFFLFFTLCPLIIPLRQIIKYRTLVRAVGRLPCVHTIPCPVL